MAYSDEFDEELLINLVRKNRELYDCTLPRYSDVVRKEKIWKEIANQVNQPVHKCKERWSNLRGSFRRAYRDHKYFIESGERPKRIKRWKYEKQMEFLVPFLKNKYDSLEHTSIGDFTNEDGNISEEVTIKNEMPPSPTSFDANFPETNSMLEEVSRTPNSTMERRGQKRPSYELEDSPSHALMQYLVEKQALENLQEKDQESDVLRSFFMYLAETVRTFPPFMQVVAKSKCFHIVSEMEMSLIKESPDQCVIPQISSEDSPKANAKGNGTDDSESPNSQP